MTKTEYLQGDDARWFIKDGYCEVCLAPARKWAKEDRFGNVEVHRAYDSSGNLVGFVCPACAHKAVVETLKKVVMDNVNLEGHTCPDRYGLPSQYCTSVPKGGCKPCWRKALAALEGGKG